MTARRLLEWKIACGLAAAGVLAADLLVVCWLDAWNDTGSVHELLFLGGMRHSRPSHSALARRMG
jgi:hypothetical protein